MTSREKILATVKKNQPAGQDLPEIPLSSTETSNLIQQFVRTLGNIGGTAIEVNNWSEIHSTLADRFPAGTRWISTIPGIEPANSPAGLGYDPHTFENVTLSILKAHFGVAENGAVWITDECMGDRALPFICEHLALVIRAEDILPTMHHAYEKIGANSYHFGTFIAGPSKTADIEQSLVLGAHGPKSMTVFLI